MPHVHQPRIRLVDGDAVTLDQCSCGAIHLTIGAVTLRLQADAFAAVAAAVAEAATVLAVRRHATRTADQLPS
jgi:ABC-type branched-subunit amino acid transport system permease subunit